MNGAIDVGFSSKVNDSAGFVFSQQFRNQGRITNISPDESVPPVVFDGGKVPQIAGISKLIQVDHSFLPGLQPINYEIRTDKTGASGNENCHISYILCL